MESSRTLQSLRRAGGAILRAASARRSRRGKPARRPPRRRQNCGHPRHDETCPVAKIPT